ncbi:MAG: SDR family oxidoreductase [Dehalococcoidia bacterium]|nr:SDR family oxidoreductase [Dehalococcoidia bacterium]
MSPAASSSPLKGHWALILGASSGFGEATALRLAQAGMNIFGVHLDRHATMPHVAEVIAHIRQAGSEAVFFNLNAAAAEKRADVVTSISARLTPEGRPLRVLLHSLAFGTLKPYVADSPRDALTQAQMDMTLDVMAHSLVYWTQDLVARGLLGRGSKIFAMTSAGDQRIWPTYGAVSAAKAALESHIRQLAVELAPKGIACNCIRAGVTDTPALRKIPGSDKLLQGARERNPSGRATTPEDVAEAIATLAASDSGWLTGNVIGVDGGEDIVG